MRYWLVMPAAGVGRRFGTSKPKQYAPLQGRTVIEWALAPFLADPACAGAVVAVAADDPCWDEVADRLTKLPGRVPELIFAQGGAERSHSVRKGLEAVREKAAPDDWVLVHDAARPCLSVDDLQLLLKRLGSHRVGGILATPAADTLKRAGAALSSGADPEIDQTVDRAGLWRALTPQMFRYQMLCGALDRAFAAGRLPTDEAQALEWAGERPLLVQGSAANIKITSADDLVLAAALLNARKSTPVAP
ncbi:MAG TPA: 2-C-methyl-D-erythritol 4-phosphate cytidylyltransferase [Steroidobacteraceae bacterium]|nr:2-C-methyl-D-erythritol 4-phosphate cytidylyltransferase [Steroidobacteraceae bacterium]